MAPSHSKLTIHPWLDAPLYNRIRYPQWKIYLYNAAQKLCTALDPTGAYCLVACDTDWDAHPKNVTPSQPPTSGGTLYPATTRACPAIAMPTFYTRQATVYERELWKLEKETYEKFDEAETTLHAAIVESLSHGTIRTINTQRHGHLLSYCTAIGGGRAQPLQSPTLQDITTVENELKRPLANFKDFLDHVTDHINNYESLRSFNQQVANITKIQTFKESIKRWPQFDALIATWEMDNKSVLTCAFSHFTDCLVNQYGNLSTDVKPRGGNAYNVRQAEKGKGKGRSRGKGKHDKGKGKSDKGRAADLTASYIGTKMMSRQTNAHAQTTIIRSARPSTSLSMMPRKGYRTTLFPSILAHLHDRARQLPTKYMAETRRHRSTAATAILIRNYTTTAITTDGTFPTLDQIAESCQTTHPTPVPKRRLHLPRIPPLMTTRP
jgi:hypothetical protein